MQRAFVEPDQPLCVAGAAATVPALIITVNDARKSGSLIVWIRREYKADGSDMEAFRREKMRANGTLNVMAEGSYGAQPVAGLEGEPGDPVVIKKRFSGFFGTDLKEMLDAHHIDTVVIAGTQTPNCVRATAFDAVSLTAHLPRMRMYSGAIWKTCARRVWRSGEAQQTAGAPEG